MQLYNQSKDLFWENSAAYSEIEIRSNVHHGVPLNPQLIDVFYQICHAD